MKSLDASKTNLKHCVGMSHIGTVDEDESYHIENQVLLCLGLMQGNTTKLCHPNESQPPADLSPSRTKLLRLASASFHLSSYLPHFNIKDKPLYTHPEKKKKPHSEHHQSSLITSPCLHSTLSSPRYQADHVHPPFFFVTFHYLNESPHASGLTSYKCPWGICAG